jgi:hypothetical protein
MVFIGIQLPEEEWAAFAGLIRHEAMCATPKLRPLRDADPSLKE